MSVDAQALADVLARIPLVCCTLELRPEVRPFSCSETRAKLLKLPVADPQNSKLKAQLQTELQQDAIRQACVSEIEMSLVPHLCELLSKLLQRKTAILFQDPYTQLVCNILCSRMLPKAMFHYLVYSDPFHTSLSETFRPTHTADNLLRSLMALRSKQKNEMKVLGLEVEKEDLEKQVKRLELANRKLAATQQRVNHQAQSNSANPLKTAPDRSTAERDAARQIVEQQRSITILLGELKQCQAELKNCQAALDNARKKCKTAEDAAREQAAAAARDLNSAKADLARAHKKLSQQVEKQRDSASEAARMGRELQQLNEDRDKRELEHSTAVSQLQAKLDAGNADLSRVRQDLADARRESGEQRKTAEAAREQAAAAAHELDSVKADLARAHKKLSQQVEKQRDSASEAARMGRELQQLKEDRNKRELEHSTAVSQLQAKLDAGNADHSRVRQDLADARRESSEQRKTAEAAREQAAAAAHELDSVKADLARAHKELSQQVEKQWDSASEAARMDRELQQLKEDRDKRELEHSTTVSQLQAILNSGNAERDAAHLAHSRAIVKITQLEATLNSANADRDAAHLAHSRAVVKNMELQEQLQHTHDQAEKIQRSATALSVTLPDNGFPVPVEFGFRFEEEPEASIHESDPEPALHRMPHIVGPPPAGPLPSPRPTEAAPALPGMPLDAGGVVRRRCRPAPAPGSTRAPKAPKLAATHTFSMQHTFTVQQPMVIMLPSPETPIPHPPAGHGYYDWLQFYEGHKLQDFAAAQRERWGKRLHYKFTCVPCIRRKTPCLHLVDSTISRCLDCLTKPSARCKPPGEHSRTSTAGYPFNQTTLEDLASFHNAAVERRHIPGKWMGEGVADFA
ncbi:hypothetical protein K438DRAFT_1812279 [Mycena galopus ATCC 62051]|nr:hypothetical protein K438DRAFT_1812279 [Mycena galopus ATCC 62051]